MRKYGPGTSGLVKYKLETGWVRRTRSARLSIRDTDIGLLLYRASYHYLSLRAEPILTEGLPYERYHFEWHRILSKSSGRPWEIPPARDETPERTNLKSNHPHLHQSLFFAARAQIACTPAWRILRAPFLLSLHLQWPRLLLSG